MFYKDVVFIIYTTTTTTYNDNKNNSMAKAQNSNALLEFLLNAKGKLLKKCPTRNQTFVELMSTVRLQTFVSCIRSLQKTENERLSECIFYFTRTSNKRYTDVTRARYMNSYKQTDVYRHTGRRYVNTALAG